MAMIGNVKRMYFREKKSVREIVRLTSLSRNTVRKWLKTSVLEEPRYRRSDTPGKLTPFHDAIEQALKVDAHQCGPRRQARTRGAHPPAVPPQRQDAVGGQHLSAVRARRSPARPIPDVQPPRTVKTATGPVACAEPPGACLPDADLNRGKPGATCIAQLACWDGDHQPCWRSPCKLISIANLLPCRMQAWLFACAT